MHYSPENLRQFLKSKKITRKRFAETLGVSKRAVDHWCLPFGSRGHRDMPAETWASLMEKYFSDCEKTLDK